MSLKRIRVLVVDDSILMRRMIVDQIQSATDIELAGVACDGREAVDLVPKLNPDVVTMDIEMPRLNGLEAVTEIMRRHPVPVVMVSSLTTRAANVTLEALNRGALDFVAKPTSAGAVQAKLSEELLGKVRFAAAVDLKVLRQSKAKPQRPSITATADTNSVVKCIALGISTGGPPALTTLFEQLKPPQPPIVVVQHMPAQFTGPFAARLDAVSPLKIKEAETGDPIEPNSVLIAPGGKHLEVKRSGGRLSAVIRGGDPVNGHKPSVDVMMRSVADVFGRHCLGVIMTGMGSDGSDGCRAIKDAGGTVIGQDEPTSAVYGMNKSAFVDGNVDLQFSLDEASATISHFSQQSSPAAPVN
ncbi:MAG: chemotaxis response regulator protein-glutamate methylesterase [Pirellulaceae bacterium]|nr:chemotaxis response regulator protein-glutamate methylesterase [Pirellulaceae bacterium]